MKINRLSFVTMHLFSVALLAFSMFSPSWAQDEYDENKEEGEGVGGLYVQIETWVAQAAGLEYHPATRIDPADPFNTQLLRFSHGTETEFRYRAGYEFGGTAGAVVLTWYAHEDLVDRTGSRPGDFVFGETQVPLLFAGFGNNGLADAFGADARTLLRDVRIDYYRDAFSTPRVSAKWFVGWRRVEQQRKLNAQYAALAPELPPLIPPFVNPRPDLDPGTDTASLESRFEGRGLGAGMDFLAPVLKDKVNLEAGFSLAILRGETESNYRATNYYYVLVDPSTSEATVLSLPYDEFGATEPDGQGGQVPVVNRIEQRRIDFGLNGERVSSTGQVMEAYVGFRWKAWRDLEVLGGFRSTRYTDVGVDLRPRASTDLGGINVQDLDEENRSATYEGFYGGIAYRF